MNLPKVSPSPSNTQQPKGQGFREGGCVVVHLLHALLWLLCLTPCQALPRLEVNGPVLTVTLKEPVSSPADGSPATARPWITDVSSIRPQATWSIRTTPNPFPQLLPALRQLRADVGYEFARLRQAPSWVEATARFVTPAADVIVQPALDVPTGETTVLVQASRGASYVWAKLGGTTSTRSRRAARFLHAAKASLLFQVPSATVSAVRLTPTWDAKNDLACTVEAVTGGPSRTKAVLQLEQRNPTLTVIHALGNGRHTIAPEIHLRSAKIVYQWDVALGSHGSSLRTKVDPVTAIHMTWTDVAASGGSWVTDVRLREC